MSMLVGDLLGRRADLTGDREALLEVATERRYSYKALEERANRAAHWLQADGVGYGDRVSLLAHNSVVYVDLLFGCAKIGAVFVPLNWRLAAAEMAAIVADCQPAILVFEAEFEATAALLPKAGVGGRYLSRTDYDAAVAPQPSHPLSPPLALSTEAAVCILYTSGTTGRPKGALISHRQILWNAINTIISWELTADDVAPIATPMFHSGGLFVFLTPLFYVGGRIIIHRHFDVDETLQLLAREGCTVVLGVPTLFRQWLDAPTLSTVDMSCVRWFISGGAPCPPSLIASWHVASGCLLRQGYGLTEVGPNCFTMRNEEALSHAGSVGKPIFHSQVRLVDTAGEDVAMGETGELLIRGPHVCSGYFNNPAATAAALRDGWFYTGDMASRDEAGFYTINGRYKDMIISGGENVYAAEVEGVLLAHPAVVDCALIGRPDDKWGEVGVMVVVLADAQHLSIAALQTFCAQRLAHYKIPKEMLLAQSLPYSPYGKVMKAQLKETYIK